MELLYAQGMLNSARSRGYGDGPEIQNPALGELLRELRDQAFQADDVLDELDYFRIQDELDGTYHAADEHGGGCLRTHALNARHTARNIRKMLGFSNCSRGSADHDEPDEDDTSGRGVKCGACPCLGPKTTPDDDEQEEDAGGRGALCEAVWPCGRATPALPRPPPTNQSDQAWLGLPPLPLTSSTLSVNAFHATLTTPMLHRLDVDSSAVPVPARHHRVSTSCRHQNSSSIGLRCLER
jgi:hypothetical protein